MIRCPFKIPVSFQIGGHTVKVVTGKKHPKDTPLFGSWNESQRIINVYTAARGTMAGETFCHELMHAIFRFSGTKGNERAIQRVALLLHQALTTMEF